MKAIIYTEYGDPEVLQQKMLEKPAVKDHEILVRVCATSVNHGDLLARKFKQIPSSQFNMPWLFWLMAKVSFGLKKPKRAILGSEFAGIVETTGKDVKQFSPGDAVFGYLGESMGAYADYMCIPETGCVAMKPSNLSFEEAAVVPYGAIMALSILQKVKIQPGQKVLINGASGGIGSAAVQIAKNLGAEVTGVCGTPRLDFVKQLGADRTIDYSTSDFTKNGEVYDVIFDVLGKSSFEQCKKSLKPNGVYLLASFKMKQLFQMLWTTLQGGKRVVCVLAPGSKQDLLVLKELVEAGKIKAIIDRRFPLEMAAEAHRYVEAGSKKGSVVIINLQPAGAGN